MGLAGLNATHSALVEVDVPPCEREQLSRAHAKVGLENEGVYRVLFGDSFGIVLFEHGYEVPHFVGREDAVAVQSRAHGVDNGGLSGACGVERGEVDGVGCEFESDA